MGVPVEREGIEAKPKTWLRDVERTPVSELETIGDHEIVRLPVGAYLPLNQVRGGTNPILGELKDSILERDLSQPGSVARMTPAMLQEYLEFVRDVWGSTTTIDQLDEYLQSDGFYYVIITGHTRHQAVLELRDEGKVRPDVQLACMVRQVASVGDILQIQLDENGIRSNPPMERSAVAIVEHYEYGLRAGYWTDPAGYLKANAKLTGRMVQDALLFSALPVDIRDLIYSRYLSYTAGVELARAAPILRSYVLSQINKDEAALSEDEQLALQIVIHDKMMTIIHQIKQAHLNGPASAKKVKGWVGSLNEVLLKQQGEVDDVVENQSAPPQPIQDAMFVLATPDGQLDEQRREANHDLKMTLSRYRDLTASDALRLIEHGSGSLSPADKRNIVTDFAKVAQYAAYIADTLL